MKLSKKLIAIILACVVAVGGTVGIIVACTAKKPQANDPETRTFTMSISTPDGVFNPYFSSSAYDSSITGLTQIGMLSTNSKGEIVCGENEPTVVKDYTSKTEGEGENAHTTYEFLIKNGIKFSDGEPLTIKDVLFNLYVYLDPAYTGSATIYSTDIIGLKSYRQKSQTVGDESAFEEQFIGMTNKRISELVDFVKYNYAQTPNDERPTYVGDWSDEKKASAKKDFETVAEKFKEELTTDWNSIDKESYKDWNFTEVWQIFLLNDGGYSELLQLDPTKPGYPLKDEDGNYKLDEEAAKVILEDIDDYVAAHTDLSRDAAIKEYCINAVFESYFPKKDGEYDLTRTKGDNFYNIVNYWATATTISDLFTQEAKTEYFAENEKVVPTVTGITTRKERSKFNGTDLNEEYDVLSIRINGVDPKAIYNFSFTVAPMHYYSTHSWTNPETGITKDYIAAFDADKGEFGLEFGNITFMNEVINAREKVGLPVGAGCYMASDENGSSKSSASKFFNNNMIYYVRNPYFETVGSKLSNAKIKYVTYKVVESDQIINAIKQNNVDYGEPSATQDNIKYANDSGVGHVEISTSGYGYVGINPRFVPNINVRRAIMKAFDTSIIVNDYYQGGLAEIIRRPISTNSWAYPKGVGVYKNDEADYKFDSTGNEIEDLVKAAGYTKNGNGVYEKPIAGIGTDTLNYKFTIAGGSTDHPAYKMFLRAQDILNKHGFDVKVVTSQTALSDLSSGKLAVWAAAWSSTIDPDMYQVYHIDSQASSTSNWGYKQIKSGKTGAYKKEYEIITELSELIDQGRATIVQAEREEIYAEALDKIMELAVEFPTYQRKDMMAYNKNVLDVKTMTPEDERSPYNGLISRIWELNYL